MAQRFFFSFAASGTSIATCIYVEGRRRKV